MAQKKRTAGKRKSSTRKRKNSRGKIYIPANSILSLCAIIVGICTALLLTSTLLSKNEKSLPPQRSTAVEKPAEKPSQKASSKSTESSKEVPVEKSKETAAKRESVSEVALVSKSVTSEKSLEKPSEKESSAWDIPDFPNAKGNAKLVIIFDDGGHNMSQLEKCIFLPFPVTVAVLPRLTHSVEAANRVRSSGNEVILHQPMQSVNLKMDPGLGAVTPDMDEDTIRSTVLQNIYEIWPISGMNNHEGSLITADAEKIATVMQICSQQEIYFLDSRTNTETKVPYVSSVMGYPYYERNVFLDNKKERKAILLEIEKGLDIANKKGTAIMIGHVWSADILPDILREVYPILNSKGYIFTTVSNSGAMKRG